GEEGVGADHRARRPAPVEPVHDAVAGDEAGGEAVEEGVGAVGVPRGRLAAGLAPDRRDVGAGAEGPVEGALPLDGHAAARGSDALAAGRALHPRLAVLREEEALRRDLPAVAAAVLVEPAHGEDALEPEVRLALDERAVAGGADVAAGGGEVERRRVGRRERGLAAGADEVRGAAEDVDALVEELGAAVGGEERARGLPAAREEEGVEGGQPAPPRRRLGAGDAGD